MTNTRFILLLPAAWLAACDGQFGAEQNSAVPVARLPDQVCSQTEEALGKLKESGGFVSNAPGQATLDESAWMRMDEPQRDQLMKVIAFDAACKAPEPVREQSAVVRSEYGRVLSERVIEVAADLSRIARE